MILQEALRQSYKATNQSATTRITIAGERPDHRTIRVPSIVITRTDKTTHVQQHETLYHWEPNTLAHKLSEEGFNESGWLPV